MRTAPRDPAPSRRKVLATGGFAHAVHDGFTDCIYVLLPLWAAAFALTHAEVGTLKMVMSGTLALTQVPAGILAERYGERGVLAAGTALAGLAYVLLGWAGGFVSLAAFLVVAGTGCGTQHPLVSSLVSRAYPAAGRRAALGTYNFTGDLGKVVAPAAVAAGAADDLLVAGARGDAVSRTRHGPVPLVSASGRAAGGCACAASRPPRASGPALPASRGASSCACC